ncbi:MAG: hypothetical protein AAGI23_05150 [Bacteroidota bacterium]
MNYFWPIISVFTLTMTLSCQSEYERMVATEMASGEQQDSLFLGIQFGMSSKEFYAHCWELNKKQLIKEGPQNMTVEYKLEDELRQEGHMYFYPDFKDDKIHEMPVTFSYDAFPWSNEASLDTLHQDVVQLMEDWYGELTEILHPEKGSVLVRVDGNRRIRVFRDPRANKVKVVFTDLNVLLNEDTSVSEET